MVERGHFSWVGPYCPALDNSRSPEFRQRSESLVRRMGYQFRLTEIRDAGQVVKRRNAGSHDPRRRMRASPRSTSPLAGPTGLHRRLGPSGRPPVRLTSLTCGPGSPGPFEVEGRLEASAAPGRHKVALLGTIHPCMCA